MQTKAILVVSFGTSYLDTLEKTITQIERKVQGQWPSYRVYRAFTSGMIRAKLKRVYQMEVDDVAQAMRRMHEDGIRDVIVAPTHVIAGIENDKMEEEVHLLKNLFAHVSVAAPLLSDADDYEQVVRILMRQLAPRPHESVVLMGHGSDHPANEAYGRLERVFHRNGHTNVRVGTVEALPDIAQVREALLHSPERKHILLAPLMIVSGDHVRNDMAGEDEDSWRSMLIADGHDVRLSMRGLGEMDEIQDLFMEHIARVM